MPKQLISVSDLMREIGVNTRKMRQHDFLDLHATKADKETRVGNGYRYFITERKAQKIRKIYGVSEPEPMGFEAAPAATQEVMRQPIIPIVPIVPVTEFKPSFFQRLSLFFRFA